MVRNDTALAPTFFHISKCLCGLRTLLLAGSIAVVAGTAGAQSKDPKLLHDANGTKIRGHLQFGQPTRLETTGGRANVITGVTDAHLLDDPFLEYSRIIKRNTVLTAGISVSFPRKGIKNVVDNDVANWTGGFVNVVVNI